MVALRSRASVVTSVLTQVPTPSAREQLADLEATQLPRVRGTAVFMASNRAGIPNVLLHHVKHNHVLHEHVVLLTIRAADAPVVAVTDENILYFSSELTNYRATSYGTAAGHYDIAEGTDITGANQILAAVGSGLPGGELPRVQGLGRVDHAQGMAALSRIAPAP